MRPNRCEPGTLSATSAPPVPSPEKTSSGIRKPRYTSGSQWFRDFRRTLTWAVALAPVGLSFAGCHRNQYRTQADQEAYCLIDEKQRDSGEPAPTLRLNVDRRSRMFDPFNPDRPPMPEDDPASARYMELVDGKKGYPFWKANGVTNTAENPDWWATLPLDERGILVLNADDAVRLALLHSPTYQQNIETLYLSALDVSSERFLLDTQFFAGAQIDYIAEGPDRGLDPTAPNYLARRNANSDLSFGPFSRGRRPFSMQRRFATGADLVVGIANSITWQVAGPNDQSATTIFDFALIQPLLRQAGRDVVLERLTLAERTLLANVRAFEQYRRGFYLQVVTGRQADAGPSRRGGLFGGAGLEGFTGLGGGFGRVAGGGGFGTGSDSGVPSAGGFIGLLQSQLEIQNQEENVSRLRDNLLRLEDTLRELLTTIPATQETIPRQQLQVSQAQQALFSAQSSLINAKAAFEQQLDAFKRTMGLPAYICVELRDPLLNQFQLISPELKDTRNAVSLIRDSVGRVNFKLLEYSKVEQDPQSLESYRTMVRTPDVVAALNELKGELEPLKLINDSTLTREIPRMEESLKQLADSLPRRIQQLNQLKANYEKDRNMLCTLLPKPELDTELFNTKEIEALPDQLKGELDRLRANMQQYQARIATLDQQVTQLASDQGAAANPKQEFENIRDKAIFESQTLIAAMAEDILALQLIEARARTETVSLPDIELEPREAVDIARRYRRDWMNARASLVNSWRAIELVADDLESYLDVVFAGDVQNLGDNPLDIRSTTGRLRVGLQWDAPITRLQERNRYRQALIEYQQARRSYYQFEDSIWTLMRSILRTIRANQVNFELQRYAVRIAARQIVLNEDIRQINEALSQASGPTAARDTVSALQDLLNAQNFFMGVWVNYEVLRRTLDQELGTMQLDSEGLWIDPGPIRLDTVGGDFSPQALMLDEARPVNLPEQVNLDSNVSTTPSAGTTYTLTAENSPIDPPQVQVQTNTAAGPTTLAPMTVGPAAIGPTTIGPTTTGPVVSQGFPLIPRPQEPMGFNR